MLASQIPREAVRLNGRVNGGWATITAHPIFSGLWVIQIVPVTKRFAPITIATGGYSALPELIRRAHEWLDERVDPDTRCLEVDAYLLTDEFRAWVERTGHVA